MLPVFNKHVDKAQIEIWSQSLINEGYLIIPNALPDISREYFLKRLKNIPPSFGYHSASKVRLFEHGIEFVALLENEPVFSLMQHILGKDMHIIALQGHNMYQGNEVLTWHADELYWQRPKDVSDSVIYPSMINVINCHYYLVDVPLELGPTEIVPRSHLAYRQPTALDGVPPSWQGSNAISLTVKAGSCVLYNNQAWHRGSPNQTKETRYAVVPTYARRFIAQRFWPFLNYHLSRDILDQCSPSQRILLGEHHRGPYG